MYLLNLINLILKRRITIKYDLTKNYTRSYNEALGIASKRHKYLKNPRTKTHSYTYYGFIYLWLAIILNIIVVILYKAIGYNGYICLLCCLLNIVYFLVFLYFMFYLLRLFISKNRKVKGSFELDKNGLTDSSFNGIKILFNWSKIKVVIITDNTITILTDTPIYFFVNKEVEDILIPALKKYKREIVIVKNNKFI